MVRHDICRDLFLDGVISLDICTAESSLMPPPSMSNISEFTDKVSLKNCLHFSCSEDDGILAESISVKYSSSQNGVLDVYTYTFEVSLYGTDNSIRDISSNGDYYVMLRKADGKSYLCYTLHGSFLLSLSVEAGRDSESCSLTITLKSLSLPIPISD